MAMSLRRLGPATPREVEVLYLVADGLTDKEIGGRLGIAISTVRTHLRRMYLRYGISSRANLAARWAGGEIGIN